MYAVSVSKKHFSWAHSAWDLTEPIATRSLFTTGSGNRKFFYTCDGNKKVSDLAYFETRNGIAAHYDYAPIGLFLDRFNVSNGEDFNLRFALVNARQIK